MSKELTTTDNQVAAYQRQATDVAGACKAIVLKTSQNIQGRKYVRVEGWQSIATAHGCIASARDVERVEGGIRAIGEVRRMDTGATLATAEGFVGDDEPTWAKRPEYARRAMAQTRAISRACRSAFAHVVVLMDAGLETTPAEEVPAGGFDDRQPVREIELEVLPPARQQQAEQARPAPRAQQRPAPVTRAAAEDYEHVTLLRVSRKDGQSSKGPWTRWGALCAMPDGSETWLNTFDSAFGLMLEDAGENASFRVELKRGPKGIDIVDLQPGVAAAPQAKAAPADGQPMADDDIPF
jgi:hypothetical protein